MTKNEIVARWMEWKIWYKNGTEAQVEVSPERCVPINEVQSPKPSMNW